MRKPSPFKWPGNASAWRQRGQTGIHRQSCCFWIRGHIHPGKMDIISASDKALKFSVGSETVKAKDPKHIFHVLGSPLCF